MKFIQYPSFLIFQIFFFLPIFFCLLRLLYDLFDLIIMEQKILLMTSLISRFLSTELTQILQYQKYFDVRIVPTQLLHQIHSERGKKLLLRQIHQQVPPHHKLRILSVIGYIIIHSDDFYEFFEDHLKEQDNLDDTWLGKQVTSPFLLWLKRCCESSELFKNIKSLTFDSSTLMHRLPYTINLLSPLLKIVSAIPKLGRYFDLKSNNKLYIMFSEVVMCLVNLIYSHLKKGLEQFLYYETQSQIRKHKDILKWVYAENLPSINETIRSTTLNKHFNFYQKGIVTKMINIREYDARLQNIMKGILDEDTIQESKQSELSSLESQIFPEDGSFNEDLFISSLSSFGNAKLAEITNISAKVPLKLKRKGGSLKQNINRR